MRNVATGIQAKMKMARMNFSKMLPPPQAHLPKTLAIVLKRDKSQILTQTTIRRRVIRRRVVKAWGKEYEQLLLTGCLRANSQQV
jgi:hypothetical protein